MAIARHQLLVLSYDMLKYEPSRTMATLLTHVGLPAQTDATLQQANTHNSPFKVEVVRCSTLAALRAHFLPHNEQLYTRLAADHANGILTANRAVVFDATSASERAAFESLRVCG